MTMAQDQYRPQYRPRMLEPTLRQALRDFPVVVLTGARQTGKTTIARQLDGGGARTFLTLDDLRVAERAVRAPDDLVAEGDSLTIDEVQRAPDLLRAIKRTVDLDRRPGRFLLTGSANLLLMKEVSESLAGRAVYLQLGPMTEAEKTIGSPGAAWSAVLEARALADVARAFRGIAQPAWPWTEAALGGGYPPTLSLTASARSRWFDGYLMSYLERDLRQISDVASLADFRRLMELAALRIGGILNRSSLARDADLPHASAHRYLNLLQTSYQIRLLEPFAKSRSVRLVKSPRLYWTDCGLGAHICGITNEKELPASNQGGAFLENLVLNHFDAWRETMVPRPAIYFWRTTSGIEVDFVIESRTRLIPIEVKSTAYPRPDDARHVESFIARHKNAGFGIVLHTGTDVVHLGPNTIGLPLGRWLGGRAA